MALTNLTVKNSSGSSQIIRDRGVTIPNSGEEVYDTLEDIRQMLTSEDLRVLAGAGTLVLNDGTQDIPIALVDEFIQWFDTGRVLQSTVAISPHRFPNRTETTISFSNANKRLTIAPTGTYFKLFIAGKLYIKTTETVDITDTEGLWYIYYNSSGVLTASQTIWNLLTDAPVAFLYWNATSDVALLFCDERHSTVMDPATHEMLHRTIGCRWASGLVLSYTVGDGSSNSHAQVSLTNGVCFDEDLQIAITDGSPQDISPIAYVPVFYLDGSSPNWRKKTANVYPLLEGTNRIKYNLNTAGTWSTTDAPTNSNYVAVYLFATNDVNHPVIAILGQRYDTTLNGARDNNKLEALAFPNVPFPEMKALYRIIFQTSATYGNTPKARFIEALDLRSGGAITGAAYTPPPSPTNVFGLFHTSSEVAAEASTNSVTPNYVNVATLNTGLIPAGKYKIQWSAEVRCLNSISNSCFYRIRQDGTTNHADYKIEFQDQYNYESLTGFKILDLAAGSYSFTFDQCVDNSVATVAARQVRFEFYRVE